MRLALILILLTSLFSAFRANAYLIGTVTGTVINGCDACENYLPDTIIAPPLFGLGPNADLANQPFTFVFTIDDAVFARPPLFDGQGRMAARWTLGPGDSEGWLTINGHSAALRGALPGFNNVGIGFNHSFLYNFDMEGESPYFVPGNHELMVAAFDSNGRFFFDNRVAVSDPVTGTKTWESVFVGTVESVKLRPGELAAKVPEPGALSLLGAGLLALISVRRRRANINFSHR